MKKLLNEIKLCTVCKEFLPLGCNPVLTAAKTSKILIIGQAPGRIVHQTNVPWNDRSGDNLRQWMGISRDVFYDTSKIALIPMGFCYPGTGSYGDLPPRKECAPLWHNPLFSKMKNIKLTLLIGQYAQNYYLKKNTNYKKYKNLTETVKNYIDYLPKYLPLPHPSPRNNIWQKRNPWFRDEIQPRLKQIVAQII